MANNKMATGAKECPFCKSDNIHYSTTGENSGQFTIVKAVCFCGDCKAYGPPVYSARIRRNEYKMRDRLASNPELKQATIDVWNKRE